MAEKTANVNARIRKDIKDEAEAILDEIGLPRSAAIDMFYRKIIRCKGLPFPARIMPAPDDDINGTKDSKPENN